MRPGKRRGVLGGVHPKIGKSAVVFLTYVNDGVAQFVSENEGAVRGRGGDDTMGGGVNSKLIDRLW